MQSDFTPFRRKSKTTETETPQPAPVPEPTPVVRPEPGIPNTTSIAEEAIVAEPGSRFMNFSWTLSRKATIILASVALLLLAGALVAVAQTRPDGMGGTYTSKRPPKPVVQPTTVASNLSGLQVQPEVNERPVTGVMVENSLDARPQSGLNQASIVFEAIAEGGITRFLALYQDNEADSIGPVRSARPYYVQWCMSFDCALGHAGGSPEALQNIRDWGTKDLDQFTNATPYTRTTDRYAPHNLYTSVSRLRELESAKGYGKANFTSLVRKSAAPSKTPNATEISINISSYAFNSTYTYDTKTNTYARNQNGSPHMILDGSSGQVQLKPSVIVVMTIPYSVASDKHSQYGVVGSGEARVFQDGTITTGAWSKTDVSAPLTLTGADGQPLALNPGQTWFVAVASSGLAIYK